MKNRLVFIHAFVPALILFFDQFTKYWVTHFGYLPFVEMNFDYIKNYGFLFSSLSHLPDNHKILGIITALCLVLAFYGLFIYTFTEKVWNLRWGISLMISGICSNAIDKLVNGYVIDWMQFYWWQDSPFFNLADFFLICGYILSLSTFFTIKKDVQWQSFKWSDLMLWQPEKRRGMAPYFLIFVITFAVTFLFSYAYLYQTMQSFSQEFQEKESIFLAYANFMLEIFIALMFYVLLFAAQAIKKSENQ